MDESQKHPDIQSSALSVLCLLAFDRANRVDIATQGGISSCIAAMEEHHSEAEVQQAGCKLLRLLAFAEENKDLIVQNGGIRTGEWESLFIRRTRHTSCSIHNLIAMSSLVVSSLQQHKSSQAIASDGCDILYFLAYELEQQQSTTEIREVVLAVVGAMGAHPQDKEVQTHGVSLLHNLACSYLTNTSDDLSPVMLVATHNGFQVVSRIR